MQGNKRRWIAWMALGVAAVGALAVPKPLWPDQPLATVSGGGTAAFDPGEELEGFTTQFSIGAVIADAPMDNRCQGDFAALGEEWEGAEAIAGDFLQASGHFMCMLQIEGEGMVVISGAISQGRLNADGSATVCGLAIVVDHFVNEVFFEQPFAATLRDGPDGFTYYDVFTGPAGDAETVVVGKIQVKGH